MNKLDKDYQNLIKDILANGVEKSDRTGTGTISVFGRQIRHNMQKGFPLLTTKKMAIKTMMTELKWFLKGDTNIKYLVDNGCNIWNGDAYKNYISRTNEYKGNWPDTMEEFIKRIKTDDEFAEKWGDLGPIYGKQWRDWTEYYAEKFNGGNPIIVERTKDQIENLINDLKTNPDSRRHIVSAWNVGELDDMVLPPCHYGFQVYTRELRLVERVEIAIEKGLTTKNSHMSESDFWNWCDRKQIPTRAISLMWNQRSVDTPLGLPFNIASYATLLILLAEEVGMIPDELIGNLGDCHVYQNQVEGCNEQLERQPYKLPTLNVSNVNILKGEFDYEIIGYESHPSIKFPLSN